MTLVQNRMLRAVAGLAGLAGLAVLVAGGAAWGAEGARMVFDRAGGFTAAAGEEVRIGARVEGGGGYGIARWEGNAPGRAEGRGNGTWVVEGAEPGMYWLRAVGWCDGTDEEVRGFIRFRVAEGGGSAAARGRLDGEATVWSEDFGDLVFANGAEMSDFHGWTGEKWYSVSNGLRIGTGNVAGHAQSTNAAMGGSPGRLEFSMWKHDGSAAVALQRSVDGGESWAELASYASGEIANTARVYSVEVPACGSVAFRWSNSGGKKRFYLDDVALYQTGSGSEASAPGLDLDPAAEEVELYPGLPYSLTATATEFDGDVVALAAVGLPEGASWEAEAPGTGSVEGTFSWTPGETGTWTVTFSASDKDGTTEKTVTFRVVPEGPGRLGFASGAVNVAKGAGTVTLTVVRTGGAAGAVGAACWPLDGTATNGTHYAWPVGRVEFADRQTRADVTIELLGEPEGTGNRTFTASLGYLSGGAAYGEHPHCTVTILDDEDGTRTYYAECYADGAPKTGAALKDALCRILNTGVRTNAYGSGLDTILRVTDACPTNADLVQCLYLQRGVQGFNKEHVWAQSHGIDHGGPAYSDLHHVRACTPAMNSARGDRDFDDRRDAAGASEVGGCWYTAQAWEPPDSAKGDVARAVLYMDVRYENKYGAKADLELVDAIGTSTESNQLGKLSTLLDWNELDPPDDFERRRNELIFTTYQYNRNPFVDHPEWARAVFEADDPPPDPPPPPPPPVWTLSVRIEGPGQVDGRSESFDVAVTNGLDRAFEIVPDADARAHIGEILQDGVEAGGHAYTNLPAWTHVWPAVAADGDLTVVFVPDTAALGTPIAWLASWGYDGDFDAAELDDPNDDSVPNWQEYRAGTDPTRPSLRRAAGLRSTEATSNTLSWAWEPVARAGGYRLRVCSTDAVPVTVDFETGALPEGWVLSRTGAAVSPDGRMSGSWGVRFTEPGDWIATAPVTNPASIEFGRSLSRWTSVCTFEVEASVNDGATWLPVATLERGTTGFYASKIDLGAWCDRVIRVRIRLTGLETKNGQQKFFNLDDIAIRILGPVLEETRLEGAGATAHTATGLSHLTEYDAVVRAEADGASPGAWSPVVRAGTPTDRPPGSPQHYADWLESRGLDPADGTYAFATAGTDDPDGDGDTNWHEYVADTDPSDPASRLTATNCIYYDDEGWWHTDVYPSPISTNRFYQIVIFTNLCAPPWEANTIEGGDCIYDCLTAPVYKWMNGENGLVVPTIRVLLDF